MTGDALDNCPFVSNAGQVDGDGVGDACDAVTCGDNLVGPLEECDDGNRTSGDGCSGTSCRFESEFRCYKAGTKTGTPAFSPVGMNLAAQFDSAGAKATKPATFCAPTSPAADPTGHTECYKVGRFGKAPKRVPRDLTVNDRFGTELLTVKGPTELCLPTGETPTAVALPFDTRECWVAKSKVPFAPRPVSLADEFGPRNVIVVKPQSLCVAANRNGGGIIDGTALLVCYRTKEALNQTKFASQDVALQNDFGTETLTLKAPSSLCVPAWR